LIAMKNPLNEDDWCWLYWFLGVGAGYETREEQNSERRAKVVRKSAELLDKLHELRGEIDRVAKGQ